MVCMWFVCGNFDKSHDADTETVDALHQHCILIVSLFTHPITYHSLFYLH